MQERIRTRFKPITDRFGHFVLYSAALYNWDEQGVSDHEIKSTIQEFVDTSKVFFDQRSKMLTNGPDCPRAVKKTLKANSTELLKDEWEAVLVKDSYQVNDFLLFVVAFKSSILNFLSTSRCLGMEEEARKIRPLSL